MSERRQGEKADEDCSNSVTKQRHGGRVAAERRHVVGYPAQSGDDVEQSVVARRVAVSGRQETYTETKEHTSLRLPSAIPAARSVGRQIFADE